MSGATGADIEQKRREISNILVSLKYAIVALEDWRNEESQRDEETEYELKMFDEIREELNKPYHHKTAGLPSPRTDGDIDTKKDLLGDNGESVVEELDELDESVEKLLSEDENVSDEKINEMIEKANEIGSTIHRAKP